MMCSRKFDIKTVGQHGFDFLFEIQSHFSHRVSSHLNWECLSLPPYLHIPLPLPWVLLKDLGLTINHYTVQKLCCLQ